jgi:ribonuclease P protein component
MGRIDWRHLTNYPAVRSALVVLGFILICLAPVLGPIPGPGGIIVFAAGLSLVLRYSAWAKRHYVRFKRRHPRKGEWADWGLRRASAKRRQERLKAEQEALAAMGQLTFPDVLPNGYDDEGRSCEGGRFNSDYQGLSDEAHLPAEQPRAQAPARLPGPDGDRRRPQDSRRPPGAGPQEPVGVAGSRLSSLTRRADFLAANRGRRVPMPGFVLLVRPRGDGDPGIRLGITVTKKIGGAVVRNRMKRRFRSLARDLLPVKGIVGADHVLIGRQGGIERDFELLAAELEKALEKVGKSAVDPAKAGTSGRKGSAGLPEVPASAGTTK